MSPAGAVSGARDCAFAVIRRVFEEGAYADRALQSEAEGLDPRDRALAMTMAYGTVQRKATLDYLATQLSSRPPDRLDPPVLAALRLGLFQIVFLGGIADHAAVNETVELVKRVGRGGDTLVNAVLRRAVREGAAIVGRLDDADPEGAALLHSVPQWIAEQWWDELGAEPARRLLRSVNRPAESALRVNTLVTTPEQVLAELPAGTVPAPGVADGLVLGGPFDVHGSALFERGAVHAQSRASMLVAWLLAPVPGQRVLDLCAAPGGKTTHLAALMRDRGEILAIERHPGRADALRRTARRLHASCVTVQTGDARERRPEPRFDRVLVDPPCSGLGTLQSRPDLRWRVRPHAPAELSAIQGQILAAAGAATAPGGLLVYSVCTISRAEGEVVIEAFLAGNREFAADDLGAEYPPLADDRDGRNLQLLPDRDGTDGFFIARLRRS